MLFVFLFARSKSRSTKIRSIIMSDKEANRFIDTNTDRLLYGGSGGFSECLAYVDCDGVCAGPNINAGCGCNNGPPSGCDSTCGSTAVDAGCGCGVAGPSGCDSACGSTAVDAGCGCGVAGVPSGACNCAGATVDACGVCGGDGSGCTINPVPVIPTTNTPSPISTQEPDPDTPGDSNSKAPSSSPIDTTGETGTGTTTGSTTASTPSPSDLQTTGNIPVPTTNTNAYTPSSSSSTAETTSGTDSNSNTPSTSATDATPSATPSTETSTETSTDDPTDVVPNESTTTSPSPDDATLSTSSSDPDEDPDKDSNDDSNDDPNDDTITDPNDPNTQVGSGEREGEETTNKDGSVFSDVAGDGSITREGEENSQDGILYVAIGGILLLFVIVFVLLLVKKRKNKKSEGANKTIQLTSTTTEDQSGYDLQQINHLQQDASSSELQLNVSALKFKANPMKTMNKRNFRKGTKKEIGQRRVSGDDDNDLEKNAALPYEGGGGDGSDDDGNGSDGDGSISKESDHTRSRSKHTIKSKKKFGQTNPKKEKANSFSLSYEGGNGDDDSDGDGSDDDGSIAKESDHTRKKSIHASAISLKHTIKLKKKFGQTRQRSKLIEEEEEASSTPTWRAVVDDASGETYYHCETTQATQWNRPEEHAIIHDNVPVQDQKRNTKRNRKGTKKEIGQRRLSEDSEKSKTDTRTVTKKKLEKKRSFRAHVDEEGREYYHEEISDQVQWNRPEEHEMREVTHDSMMDPESRRNFYINKKTGRSTWTDHDATEIGI